MPTQPTSRVRRTSLVFLFAACLSAPSFAQQPRLPEVRPISLPTIAPRPSRSGALEPSPAALATHQRLRSAIRMAGESRYTPNPKQSSASVRLRADVSGPVRIAYRGSTGTPCEIKGGVLFERNAAVLRSGESRALATARGFLERHRDLLRLEDPGLELSLVSERRDGDGHMHLRFQQEHHGVPVEPGEIVVHLDENGDVVRMNGAFSPTPVNARVVPGIAASTAIEMARSALDGGRPQGAPRLVLWTTPGAGTARLVWRVLLATSPLVRREMLVDANTGQLLRNYDDIHTQAATGSGTDLLGQLQTLNLWRTGGEFRMADTSKSMFDAPNSPDPADANNSKGVIYVFDAENQKSNSVNYVTSSDKDSWPIADSVSASDNLSRVYDYFLTRHGRTGLDGDGGNMYGIVRYDTDLSNAFWDGTAMYFGDGDKYAGALDVVAHELSHGVITHTANLEYLNQSGALNESFADVFGEAAESFARGSTDWRLGTDLSSPIRDMANPNSFQVTLPGIGTKPLPANMSQFIDLPSDVDNGGVHINSSIPNHAFYLLAEGLANSIGIVAAEQIFYKALTDSLTKNSNFVDLRLAVLAAAEAIDAAHVPAVTAAFDQVEIGSEGGADGGGDDSYDPVASADSTIFLFTGAENTLELGRLETGLGDPAIGSSIYSATPLTFSRPAVSGDGTFCLFVDENADVFFMDTASLEILPDGQPLTSGVNSVAVSPDGTRYAFVFLEGGQPSNRIELIDISADTSESFEVTQPDGDHEDALNTVLFADAMSFSPSGRILIYDALTALGFGALGGDDDILVWSLYALDLATGTTLTVIPAEEGINYAYPSFAHTSDDFLVFDALDESTLESTVVTANLVTGDTAAVDTVPALPVGGGQFAAGFAVPGYSGDDTAIVYSKLDESPGGGIDLASHDVTDRLTPNGAPSVYIALADFGVVYRRGTFNVPNDPPDGQIFQPEGDVQINVGDSVTFAGSSVDPNGNPVSYSWNFECGATGSSAEDPGAVTFATEGTFTASLTVTDSLGSSDPTPATRTITVGNGGQVCATASGGGGGCVAGTGRLDLAWIALGLVVLARATRRVVVARRA